MTVRPREETSEQEWGLVRSVQLELQPGVQAPTVARAAVSGLCHELDCSPSQCDTLMLLVSELVSNAVLHSRGPADAPIFLAATVGENAALVAVIDAGHGFTRAPLETPPADGGYGLHMVDKVATRWGVDQVGGTRVWFELPLSACLTGRGGLPTK